MSRVVLMALALLSPSPAVADGADPVRPIDVYPIGGQSNATGRGYLVNLPKGFEPDPRVLLFHSDRPHLDSGAEPKTWVPLLQASKPPDRFGPELGFGKRLQGLTPGRTIALIKHAWSGSDPVSRWNPGRDAADREHFGPQFRAFIETVDLGLKGLRERGSDPIIRGMVRQQGESDSKGPDVAAAYGANLAHFIARAREQFGSPDLVFVYGYVVPTPNEGPGRDLVRKGQKEVDQAL